MSKSKTIITICYKHRRGGHCKRLYMMIQGFLDAGYQVHSLSVEPLKIKDHSNFHQHLLKIPGRGSFGIIFWCAFTLFAPIAVLYYALTKRASAIVVFDAYYSALSCLAQWIGRRPIFLMMRANPWRVNKTIGRSFLMSKLSGALDELGLLVATKIVAVTEVMKEELGKMIPSSANKLVVVPNSILFPKSINGDGSIPDQDLWNEWLGDFSKRKRAVAKRYGLKEKNFFVVTCGELTSRKNIEHVVRAISATENKEISLIICGDGPEKHRITTIIIGLGLKTEIVYAGWLDDPIDVISGCDLLVMPSLHEGMSNAMLEAMGAGVSVVAADIPEMREVLVDDRLFIDSEHVENLAKRLNELERNKQDWEKVKELSREQASRFTFNWGEHVVKFVERAITKSE